ncbi:4-hydroxy-tetrahydrodipicolinate reductase [Xiamenia xianingshaonis]|uniref:4-hydroxy-tetrahydrodipicolinate reductase n=1 Tax=Xiamenia xianingshaonis TaxID=2682776 RepID=A0A9E6MS90_9ACTN|nr:4-hydroxy-tetrahydrodipicolinate reductase [Xiamenia xianingshaonis]NHM13693.1 4-hydroxy-tetrahydrodipicolinate reductase [Xiamenia xianingshaonis]QTU85063.1 4-hydroxy-tetrahydrodipicolinate reductase [Xiamenia xianingshaonis]
MITVAVAGCAGRMGSAVVDAVKAADDLELVCGIDPSCPRSSEEGAYPVHSSVQDAIDAADFDVLVDFTRPDVVEGNLRVALPAGVDCVVGTTGLSDETLAELAALAPAGTCLFYAPNFTTGAVLMMEFAKAAAPYFPEAEVIEMHHCKKLDAPSGTAVRTAALISEARGRDSAAPGKETEIAGAEGARGALVSGVPVHSVRSMGFVASQEAVFGSLGQTLTIRHDSWDRTSYMPGVLLGIRSVGERDGLIVGLENFMA